MEKQNNLPYIDRVWHVPPCAPCEHVQIEDDDLHHDDETGDLDGYPLQSCYLL